jgi:hypothetical protein
MFASGALSCAEQGGDDGVTAICELIAAQPPEILTVVVGGRALAIASCGAALRLNMPLTPAARAGAAGLPAGMTGPPMDQVAAFTTAIVEADAETLARISAEPLLGPVDLVNGGVRAVPYPPDGQDDYPAFRRQGVPYCRQVPARRKILHASGVTARPGRPDSAVNSAVGIRSRNLGAGPKGGDQSRSPGDLKVRQFPPAPVPAGARPDGSQV